MLYYLHQWQDVFSPLRVFQYITVRTFAAGATAFLLSLLFGPAVIRLLRRLNVGQQVRTGDDTAVYQLHGNKQGTPTMGGLLIILTVALSVALWAEWRNGYVWFTLATMLYMGSIGFLDDYLKVARKNSKGLKGRHKLALQLLWVGITVGALYAWPQPATREFAPTLMVPFLKTPLLMNMGMFGTFLFVALVVLGSSNAVNLTDGLDGLAIGCSNAVVLAYLALAYIAGNFIFSDYLHLPYIPGVGELTVFCGALLGAGLGFLWFNCHPAKVFMGDTGSLSLGGTLAIIAIFTKHEVLLVLVGGVFVMEALSVLIQVASFKATGKRVFKCAPIHHHFELVEKERAKQENRDLEVVETMITTRFWILGIIFALIGLATIKIR